MVNVNVNFNGRDYLLACEEGQEEDLQKLTEELSKKFNQLKKDLGNLGEGKLLLITAIQVIEFSQYKHRPLYQRLVRLNLVSSYHR